MKKYLSLGGGVNSVALLLLLLNAGEDFETVFCDTGVEQPETIEYVKMVNNEVSPVTVIRGINEVGRTLYNHCVYYRTFPTRRWKWCADRFKIKPLNKFFERPCICFVGIGADESNRATVNIVDPGIEKRFPLIDRGITRAGCLEIIKQHGLLVPDRSGCYICPFQSKVQWRRLYSNHRELYEEAKYLETITNQRLQEKGNKPRYYRDIPIYYLVNECQACLSLK